MLGTILLGASVLAVSAQTAGGDSGAGQGTVTNQEVDDDGGLGPRWTRDNPCNTSDDDPDGRGGPSWLCDHGGTLIEGAAASNHPGQGRGQGGGGVFGFTTDGHPGNGTPRWMTEGFKYDGDEDGGRGGPAWACGDGGLGTLDAGGGENGPAWMRLVHPGQGHGAGGDGDE